MANATKYLKFFYYEFKDNDKPERRSMAMIN